MDNNEQTRWQKGKKYALYFYRKMLPLKSEGFNQELYLPDYFTDMIGDKKEVTIAELGSGIFSTIGSEWKTAKVNIFPSDILADEYNQILTENNISPLIPIAKQDMQHLTYPDNFFDIVHCTNALDHCLNPIKAMGEMYRICKPGGYIYLRHFLHVGTHERYRGMHFWNLDITENKDCTIWNQDEKHLLSTYLPGFINSLGRLQKSKIIVSILQKQNYV